MGAANMNSPLHQGPYLGSMNAEGLFAQWLLSAASFGCRNLLWGGKHENKLAFSRPSKNYFKCSDINPPTHPVSLWMESDHLSKNEKHVIFQEIYEFFSAFYVLFKEAGLVLCRGPRTQET